MVRTRFYLLFFERQVILEPGLDYNIPDIRFLQKYKDLETFFSLLFIMKHWILLIHFKFKITGIYFKTILCRWKK